MRRGEGGGKDFRGGKYLLGGGRVGKDIRGGEGCRGVPIPEGNWYPVVVEVVYAVPGSIPERVQYANMDDWRMDCFWWIVLLYNPVSGLQRFLLSRNHEYCYGTEGP